MTIPFLDLKESMSDIDRDSENQLLSWILLLNRPLCFEMNIKFTRRFLNLNILIFVYESILNARKLNKKIS